MCEEKKEKWCSRQHRCFLYQKVLELKNSYIFPQVISRRTQLVTPPMIMFDALAKLDFS